MRYPFWIVLLVFLVPPGISALQNCEISYLGRNASQSLPGEPGAVTVPEMFLKPQTDARMGNPFFLRSTYGERLTGDSYASTNKWRMYIATPLDSSSELEDKLPALDVFEISCTDPE
jgi:hypothetical protein